MYRSQYSAPVGQADGWEFIFWATAGGRRDKEDDDTFNLHGEKRETLGQWERMLEPAEEPRSIIVIEGRGGWLAGSGEDWWDFRIAEAASRPAGPAPTMRMDIVYRSYRKKVGRWVLG